MHLNQALRRASVLAALLAMGCDRAAAPATGAAVPSAPPNAAPSPSPISSAFTAAVDALAAEAIERGPIAGLSIAVFQHGQPVLAKGYGSADVEAGVPATADTSYPIASVSKHFTAAAILRLADQGKLSLDDPLSRFFPSARAAIGALTVRHLLDHTSGLTRPGPAPRAAAMSVLSRGGTARGQGEDWDYSNYNYSLLGLVIEKASGRDYGRYVQEDLAAPLGLTGTGYCEDGSAVPGRGRDYQSAPRSVSPTGYWAQAKFFAAGGLCSTVRDLVRFATALDEGRVVSPSMLQAMRTPTRLVGGLEVDYGYGTRLGRTGSHRKFGHTGGGQSNKAVLARYPDDDVTVAVLLNTERSNAAVTATDIEEHVERLFFDRAEGPAPAAPAAAGDLHRFAGSYVDGPRLVRVAIKDEGLSLRPGLAHRLESRLVPTEGGLFVDAADPTVGIRFPEGEGQAAGYERYHNGWFVGFGARSQRSEAAGGSGQAR
jgi:D-alanyl-D-alanine carboxypeptidase